MNFFGFWMDPLILSKSILAKPAAKFRIQESSPLSLISFPSHHVTTKLFFVPRGHLECAFIPLCIPWSQPLLFQSSLQSTVQCHIHPSHVNTLQTSDPVRLLHYFFFPLPHSLKCHLWLLLLLYEFSHSFSRIINARPYGASPDHNFFNCQLLKLPTFSSF